MGLFLDFIGFVFGFDYGLGLSHGDHMEFFVRN